MRYQQIFDEAIGHTPPTTIDVDQVVRRQRRAAKVRPALAAVAAVLVAAAGTGTAIQLTGEDGGPVQVPGGELAGFPEYAEGARVIAAESAPFADGSLSLTFTPTTSDLVLFTRCDTEPAEDVPVVLYAELATGAATASPSIQAADNGFCFIPVAQSAEEGRTDGISSVLGPEHSQNWEGWETFWAAMQVGEPTTITVELLDAAPICCGGNPSIPSDGTFGLAVAERVPFEEYQFPSRPEELEPLPEGNPVDFELRADPDDPNRRVEGTVAWEAAWCDAGLLPLGLHSQTPGSLQVLVSTSQVAYHTWWDYEQTEPAFSLDPACGGPDSVSAGDEVTIAVEPEHMTGDWWVSVSRAGG
jgi:hypothetical protein